MKASKLSIILCLYATTNIMVTVVEKELVKANPRRHVRNFGP
jgi:hypothetical protein